MAWLSGWFYRKKHMINPAEGAGSGYQIRIKVHFGAGTDFGEDVYCGNRCRADFGDIRFTDGDGGLLDYWMQSKSEGDYAVFWVEVAGSLESTAQTVYVYYGKNDAANTSSQATTFVDVIDGVVAAFPLDEAEQEVNPTVIYDDEGADFWSVNNYGTGSYDCSIVDETGAENVDSGAKSVKASIAAGIHSATQIIHTYSSNQNWSSKNLIKLHLKGASSGATIRINMDSSDAGNTFYYDMVDNWSGYQTKSIPFSNFTVVGSPSWSSVRIFHIDLRNSQSQYSIYIDRIVIDVGVPAQDKSGYGSHGQATGTTIVAGKFAGKNARMFNGLGDRIVCGNPLFGADSFSVFFFMKSASPIKSYGPLVSKGNSNGVRWSIQSNDVVNSLRVAVNDGVREGGGDIGLAPFNGNWNAVAVVFNRNTQLLMGYLNKASGLTAPDLSGTGSLENNTALVIGARWANGYAQFYNGAECCLIVTNTALTQTNINNLSDNYPDATLEAGKILVRKYAASVQPAHDIWGGVEHFAAVSDSFSLEDGILGHAGGLRVDKAVVLLDGVFVVETVEAGKGDRRTRLFLILDNLAIQLTAQ